MKKHCLPKPDFYKANLHGYSILSDRKTHISACTPAPMLILQRICAMPFDSI